MNISPVKTWRGQDKIRKLLGRKGVIVSFTMIHIPPKGFTFQAPYPVVMVKLSDSMHVFQMVDYERKHLKVGQRVQVVLRKIMKESKEGIIMYGAKVMPIK